MNTTDAASGQLSQMQSIQANLTRVHEALDANRRAQATHAAKKRRLSDALFGFQYQGTGFQELRAGIGHVHGFASDAKDADDAISALRAGERRLTEELAAIVEQASLCQQGHFSPELGHVAGASDEETTDSEGGRGDPEEHDEGGGDGGILEDIDPIDPEEYESIRDAQRVES